MKAKKLHRPIFEIAREIRADWKNVWYGAEPYVKAMSQLDQVTDKYGEESCKSIILYFLTNAEYWRGDTARRIKKELKTIIK